MSANNGILGAEAGGADASSDVHWETPHCTPPDQRVPPLRKIAYGLGSLTEFFYANVVGAMAMPIFSIAMKLDPAILGVALAATKVVGALTDPIVGALSDNTQSRWGRRRPFIVVGAVVGAVMLPLLWMVPAGSTWVSLGYVVGMISIFSVFYSIFAVPYGALGLELTRDYDERTRVFAWRGYIQTAGTFSAAWFYWFCLRPAFGNEIVGVRVLSIIAGVIMLLCMVAAVRGSREVVESEHRARQPRIPLGQALKRTFSNRPFLLVQAAALVVALGTGVDGPIGMYLHVYYTCQGNKQFASLIGGMGGTLATLSIFLAAPLGVMLSTHMGKREGALAGMGLMLVSVLILPFVLTPAHPYWVISSWLISTVGMQCASLMFSSMMADICDEDELATGLRREGAYVAGASFLGKTCQVIVLLVGGALPRLAGYSDFSKPPTLALLERMKWLLIGTQLAGVLASLTFLWFYPLTRARSEVTRALLSERKKLDAADPPVAYVST